MPVSVHLHGAKEPTATSSRNLSHQKALAVPTNSGTVNITQHHQLPSYAAWSTISCLPVKNMTSDGLVGWEGDAGDGLDDAVEELGCLWEFSGCVQIAMSHVLGDTYQPGTQKEGYVSLVQICLLLLQDTQKSEMPQPDKAPYTMAFCCGRTLPCLASLWAR